MNRLIMMGRLVADPEVRYGAANGSAVANFRIAVDRRFKRDGDPDAKFAEKYLRKGTKILLECEIRNNNYTGKDGNMVYSDQIIANSIEFAESKNAQSNNGFGGDMGTPAPNTNAGDGFMNIPDGIEEELPFN